MLFTGNKYWVRGSTEACLFCPRIYVVSLEDLFVSFGTIAAPNRTGAQVQYRSSGLADVNYDMSKNGV